ncbi:MAG: hypothetical protein RLY93_08185 [Sumerlaeia bacterium]
MARQYAVGDCVLIADVLRPGSKSHLYLVITSPKDHPEHLMLLPCVVTRRRTAQDTSCTLNPGCHPFIRQASVVDYRHARALTPEILDRLIEQGFATIHEAPMPPLSLS